MELRFTHHAEQPMAEQGISRADVEAVLGASERVRTGESAVEYDGMVAGRPLRVVVLKGSQPPLIITVFEIWR